MKRLAKYLFWFIAFPLLVYGQAHMVTDMLSDITVDTDLDLGTYDLSTKTGYFTGTGASVFNESVEIGGDLDVAGAVTIAPIDMALSGILPNTVGSASQLIHLTNNKSLGGGEGASQAMYIDIPVDNTGGWGLHAGAYGTNNFVFAAGVHGTNGVGYAMKCDTDGYGLLGFYNTGDSFTGKWLSFRNIDTGVPWFEINSDGSLSTDLSMKKTSAQGYISAWDTAGTDYIYMYHDGDNGNILTNSGSLLLGANSGMIFTQHTYPGTDNTYDLGYDAANYRWRNLFLSGNATIAGTGTFGTVTGTNVTSGANPGHTHTGSAISGIDISDDTNLSGSAPLILVGDEMRLGYNATNLKITGTGLDTIQDIATTSTPTFAGANITGTLNGITISGTNANLSGAMDITGNISSDGTIDAPTLTGTTLTISGTGRVPTFLSGNITGTTLNITGTGTIPTLKNILLSGTTATITGTGTIPSIFSTQGRIATLAGTTGTFTGTLRGVTLTGTHAALTGTLRGVTVTGTTANFSGNISGTGVLTLSAGSADNKISILGSTSGDTGDFIYFQGTNDGGMGWEGGNVTDQTGLNSHLAIRAHVKTSTVDWNGSLMIYDPPPFAPSPDTPAGGRCDFTVDWDKIIVHKHMVGDTDKLDFMAVQVPIRYRNMDTEARKRFGLRTTKGDGVNETSLTAQETASYDELFTMTFYPDVWDDAKGKQLIEDKVNERIEWRTNKLLGIKVIPQDPTTYGFAKTE